MMFTLTQNRWKIDDVLGVWPLHGLCGAWGGIAAGIFGSKALGGIGGVALMPQLLMTGMAIAIALIGSCLVYGAAESRPSDCASIRNRNTTAPTSRSTRSRLPPSAKPTGRFLHGREAGRLARLTNARCRLGC
jgi:hypothetical protein